MWVLSGNVLIVILAIATYLSALPLIKHSSLILQLSIPSAAILYSIILAIIFTGIHLAIYLDYFKKFIFAIIAVFGMYCGAMMIMSVLIPIFLDRSITWDYLEQLYQHPYLRYQDSLQIMNNPNNAKYRIKFLEQTGYISIDPHQHIRLTRKGNYFARVLQTLRNYTDIQTNHP